MNTAACKYVWVFSIDYAYIKFSGCFCVWVLPLCCGIVNDVIMTLFLELFVKICLFSNMWMTRQMEFTRIYRFSIYGRPDGWILKMFMDFKELDDPTIRFLFFCCFWRFGRPDGWIFIIVLIKHLDDPTVGF